jgi:phosphoribosylformimino-5-aminoimidazole carboxamide ribotide isomerase
MTDVKLSPAGGGGAPPVSFELLPAIDLRGGRVVRLEQGSFERETVFGDQPAATASQFRRAGARWVHVVDLDGAKSGRRVQDAVIADIVRAATVGGGYPLQVQVAGGLRGRDSVADALAAGASRVVLGTAALKDPGLVTDLVTSHGSDGIAVALDVRDGLAVGQGWVSGAAGVPAIAALARLRGSGVTTFVVTAIARDGLLGGPDLDLLRETIEAGDGASIIASGGIASVDDLVAVRELGCAGAVVGRALYDGRLSLEEAIAATSA